MSNDPTEDSQFPLAFTDNGDDPGAVRRPAKSDSAFRTISEVATDLGVPQHVLRFWESKFSQVHPLKRGGGRRYYRPEDVALLRRIRALLYDDGMTIRGVQKVLRETHARSGSAEMPEVPTAVTEGLGVSGDDLRQVLAELTALRDDLRDALREA